MKRFLKKPLFWILVVAIIFAGWGVYAYVKSSNKSPYETAAVKKGDIIQEVSVTGRVKPAESVDLAFEKSGRVVSVNVKIGDRVAAGQVLASLANGDLAAQVNQAKASLEKEQATLKQYQSGTRSEEIQLAETKVANAEKTLVDAESNLSNVKSKAVVDLNNLYEDVKDVLNDAHVKADDALNKQIDELFVNDQTSDPQLIFYTSSQAESDAEAQRWQAGAKLNALKTLIDSLGSSQLVLDSALNSAENYLTVIKNSLDADSVAVNLAGNLTQATITNYKYYINTGRTNVVTALTSISTQKQAIATQKATNQSSIAAAEAGVNTAKSALLSARDELAIKQAGYTSEQIAAQEAQVKYAWANLQNYQAQLTKTIIVSPLNGIVTKKDMKVGEIVSANVNLVSVMSAANFEIEANVPEADVAKVKVGQIAAVTLDTYGNDVVFEARVISIEPAETIVEGVATYKTKFQFTKEDERIKSGMTANIDIQTAEKKDVLVIPQRIVTGKNGDKTVKVLAGEEVKEVKVELGLRGSDGKVEVLSGLKEGDKIIISQKQ